MGSRNSKETRQEGGRKLLGRTVVTDTEREGSGKPLPAPLWATPQLKSIAVKVLTWGSEGQVVGRAH